MKLSVHLPLQALTIAKNRIAPSEVELQAVGGELLFLAGKTQMALSASDLKKALALLFPGESSSGLITSAAPAADPYNLSRPEATPEGNVVAVKRISPRYGMTARRSPAVRAEMDALGMALAGQPQPETIEDDAA